MERDIYQTPSAELARPAQVSVSSQKRINPSLLGFFVSPLATSFLVTLFINVYDFVFSSNNVEIAYVAYKAGGMFVVVSAFLSVYLFAFGLLPHWVLGRIGKRKYYLYLAAGAIAPLLILLVLILLGRSDLETILGFIPVSGTGAVCFSIFWYIAVYLPRKGAL